MVVGLHSFFCWASEGCLCCRGNKLSRRCLLVGKQAAFQSMDSALRALRSMKPIKMHVVGQCPISVPSE